MANEETQSHVSADKPLTNPNEDRLGYAPFAKNLAESILKMMPPEGVILAIYGEWGSGKTTVLEFVRYYLEEKSQSTPPIVIPFNPWWFSGQEDLARQFFTQLQIALANKLQRATQPVVKQLGNLADIVSEGPGTVSWVGKLGSRFLQSQKDVAKLKQAIAGTLKNQKQRIVIIIDDIDRLTAEEIRQLFGVIKAVADFPNIIYVLAFDKAVVVNALEKSQGGSGEDYLEKIVQVPFELPLPDSFLMSQMLFEKLNIIFEGTPSELWDSIHWGNVYHDGIKHFVKTPRDVVRLTNTLSVTYPGVEGEVNVPDFISVEALRVFFPSIYDVVRRNKEMFVSQATDFYVKD